MTIQISGLLVGNQDFSERELQQALLPEFTLEEFGTSSALSDAFQILVNNNFNLCFISERVTADLDAFFADMRTLGRDKTCAFVRVRMPTSKAKGHEELEKIGFCAEVTPAFLEVDQKHLRKALRFEIQRMEAAKKVEQVPSCVELALKELDKVARNRLRGRENNFDQVLKNLVKSLSSSETELLERYFDALAEKSDTAAPFSNHKVDIPEPILSRNLPKLEREKYSGASDRVWKKLLKKFGTDAPTE